MRTIRNRYLPQWLHRLACGVVGAAIVAVAASAGLRYCQDGTWLHTASGVLLFLGIPVGIILACVAHRFSIVEGSAGGLGYEDLDPEAKSQARDGHDGKPHATDT